MTPEEIEEIRERLRNSGPQRHHDPGLRDLMEEAADALEEAEARVESYRGVLDRIYWRAEACGPTPTARTATCADVSAMARRALEREER